MTPLTANADHDRQQQQHPGLEVRGRRIRRVGDKPEVEADLYRVWPASGAVVRPCVSC